MRGTGVFTWYRFLNSKATVQNKTELILQLGIKKLTHFYYKVFLYFWFDGHCHLMNKMKWINKIIDLSSKNCVWINPNCRWHKKKKKDEQHDKWKRKIFKNGHSNLSPTITMSATEYLALIPVLHIFISHIGVIDFFYFADFLQLHAEKFSW